MSIVNQTELTLSLRDYLGGRDHAWGSTEGSQVRDKLAREIEANPEACIVRISLEGVKRTDASFARESVIELAARYRGRRGICVVNVESEDLLENWSAAALIKGQPMIAWTRKGPKLLGPQPRMDTQALLGLVLDRGVVTTAEAARALKKQVNNVSTRLKRLFEEGLIFRCETTATSGGVEYRYLSIK